MSNATPYRAAVYCRISNDPSGKAAGVQRQETECRDLVKDRGWDLAGVWVDNDRSATDRRKAREQFNSLMAEVESGSIDTIVVWHVDRLYRQPRELQLLLDLIEGGRLAGGIQTVSAGEMDLNTASGRLVARILVDVAIAEVERTGERLEAMNRHAALAGKRVGGRRPFGYESDGITIREAEATEYRTAVAKVLEGESVRSIALDLKERGVKTASGGDFSATRLRTVLLNPRYAGLRTYRKEIVGDANWPPLVDRSTWERLRAVLNDPRRKTSPGPAPAHLLSGFLECGKCGGRLGSGKSGGKGAYRCLPTRSGGCGGVVILEERLDDHVTEWLFDVLESPNLGNAIANREVPDTETVLAELQDLERRGDDLAYAFASGDIDRRQLTVATDALRARRTELESDLAASPAPPTLDGFEIVKDAWSTYGLEFRREIVAAVIDKVVVNPTSNRGSNTFEHDRVDVRQR